MYRISTLNSLNTFLVGSYTDSNNYSVINGKGLESLIKPILDFIKLLPTVLKCKHHPHRQPMTTFVVRERKLNITLQNF